MSDTQLRLKVLADAKAAVAGLKPLETSLEGVTESAQASEDALDALGKAHKVKVNDDAVENARREIQRLREQMRRDLSLDVNADTKEAQRRIRSLQGSIRAIEGSRPGRVGQEALAAERGLTRLGKSFKGIGGELTSGLTSASGALGGLAGAAGPAGIAVAAVAGAAAIAGKAIWDLAQQASGLEQAIGASDSVFKDTSQAMQDFADTAAQSAGLSERAYLEMATVIGAQLKNLGFSLSESAGMTTELLERGADLAATFGGTTAQAVEALGSALRGEMDPIERYGISLNQAAVNGKALELGLWSGKGALDQHSKAVSVNALIMEQSADAAGQFARESDELAGQQQKLNAEWENMTTTLGEGVLPLVTDFFTVGNYLAQTLGDLTDKGGALNDVWGKIPGPLQGVAKAAGAALNPLVGLAEVVHMAAGEIEEMPPKLEATTAAQQALAKQTNDYAYAMGVAGKAAADQAGELEGLVVGSEEYDKALGKSLKSLRDLVPALDAFTDEQITGTAVTDEQVSAFDDLKSSISGIQGSVDDSVSSLTDLSAIYKTVTEDGKKAFDAGDFITEQKKRNTAVKNWRDNLATLADRGLSQDVINNLANMGVEGGAALVESLAKKTSDKELAKIGDNWTFGQSLGEQIGNQVAVAMIDAMDGVIDKKLNGKPIEVPVGMDTEAADKKHKDLKDKVEKKPVVTKVEANTKAAEDAIRNIPVPDAVIKAAAETAAATRALDRAARDRTAEITAEIKLASVPKVLSDYLSNPHVTVSSAPTTTSTTPLGPQLLVADTATIAGLGGSGRLAQQRAGGSGRPTVTEVFPRQVPVKVYLDGAEIADHLTLKSQRLATVSSVRRRP